MRFLRRLAYAGLALAFSRVVLGAVARVTGAASGIREAVPAADLAGGEAAVRSSIVGAAAATADRALAVATGAALLALLGAALLRRREPGVGERGGVLRAATLAAGVGAASAALVAFVPAGTPAWLGGALRLALVGVLAVAVMRAGGLGAGERAVPAPRTVRPRARSIALATLAALLAPVAALLGPPALTWAATATTVVLMLLVAATSGVLAPRDGWSDTEAARAGRIALGTLALQSVVGSALATVALPGAAATMHEALGAIVWLALVVSATLVRRVSVAAESVPAPVSVEAAPAEAAAVPIVAPAVDSAPAIASAALPAGAVELTESIAAPDFAATTAAGQIEHEDDRQPERDDFRFPTFPLPAPTASPEPEPAHTEIAAIDTTAAADVGEFAESPVALAAVTADVGSTPLDAAPLAVEHALDDASPVDAELALYDAAPIAASDDLTAPPVEHRAVEAVTVEADAVESLDASLVEVPHEDVAIDMERPLPLEDERGAAVIATADLLVEAPIVEQTIVEAPIVEEETVAEPILEEAIVEEAIVEEAIVAQPTAEELPVEELSVEQPMAEHASADDATANDATVERPIDHEAVASGAAWLAPTLGAPIVEAPIAEAPVVEASVVEAAIVEAAIVEAPAAAERIVDDVAIEPTAVSDASADLVIADATGGDPAEVEPELVAPIEVAHADAEASVATAAATGDVAADVVHDDAVAEEGEEEPFPGAGELMDVPDYEPAARWAQSDAELDDADVDELVIDGPLPASVFERELALEVEREREEDRERDRLRERDRETERERDRERERERARERDRDRERYEDRAPAPVVGDSPEPEPVLAMDAPATDALVIVAPAMDALPPVEAALGAPGDGVSADATETAEPTITPLPRRPRRPPTLAVLLARGADF